jgi:hypothetical protein
MGRQRLVGEKIFTAPSQGGGRISFVKGFIIGYLFVVHVFVVYISRRDEGR